MSVNNPFLGEDDEAEDVSTLVGKEPAERIAEPIIDEASATNDSDLPVRMGHASINIHPNKTPNQDWIKDWSEASNLIHNAEICGSSVNAKLSISVHSPETVSSMMSKHVVYFVKTDPLSYNVRRRYNDFAWLREKLATKYQGMYVPSIPATTAFSGKNSMGKKTDVEGDFVKNRMAQLHFFMQQLCDIPFLRTDPDLGYFLSVENEKEFKSIMDTSTPVVASVGGLPATEQSNEGLKLWLLLVDKTELNPVEAEKAIAGFKHQLDVLRSALNQVDIECRTAGKRAVACSRAMGSLSDMFGVWVGHELELLDPKRSECVNTYGGELSAAVEAVQSCHAHWAQNISLIPKIIARVIISNVQFQLQQVSQMRAFMQARDSQVKELEKAQRERVKALDDKRRAISPTRRQSALFAKGAQELESILQKKTEVQNSYHASVERLTKALVFCEMDRFNRERMQSIRALLASLTTIHMQIASTTTAKWSETAAALGLSLKEFDEFVGTLSSPMDSDDVFGD